MIVIKFFSNFCSSQHCIDTYIRIAQLNDDPYFGNTYRFTNDNDYTHAIIINTAMPNLNVKKENVIGLAFEPIQFLGLSPDFIRYATNNIGKYYIGDASQLPNPFMESFTFMWHNEPVPKIVKKPKKMSIMISNKTSAPGHIYRHKLVRYILDSKLNIDIFGRGCAMYSNIIDDRLKGKFKHSYEMLNDYEYHICIENFVTPHYFSEKIIDPLLSNTIPIYIGCANINRYFNNMLYHLTGNLDEDFALIQRLHDSPRTKEIDIEQVKSQITIKKLINSLTI